jgi:hypothetical protein
VLLGWAWVNRRLAGRLVLVVEVFDEVDAVDHRQLLGDRLAEDGLIGVLEHHLERVADRAGEQQRHVVGA